jgi:hypothetical protein
MSSSDGVTLITADVEHFPDSSNFESDIRLTSVESKFSNDGNLWPSIYMIFLTFGMYFKSFISFGNNVCDVIMCVTSVSFTP